MSARFALYLAPEAEEDLWRFGSDWLGYDAETRETVPHPALSSIDEEALHAATAHPRLYGFHLTLKAPFRLAEGMTPDDLERATAELAARHRVFGPVALSPVTRPAGQNHHFLCLEPSSPSAAMMQLEADAVIGLDALRAPLDAQEIARRRPERLDQRELGYLKLYGYPHVLDAFQPHFSLTGPVEDIAPYRTAVAAALAENPALAQFTCRSIAMFEQPEQGARFFVRRRFALTEA
jgi:Protein of unknown function (DUF1045)